MLANQSDIAKLIPHAGNMCLLQGILECDQQHIRCISSTHRDPSNPLRTGGELAALCGIEYAAQAMATHGAWTGQPDSKPRAGYLTSLRDVICHTMRLDTLPQDLIIDAEKIMGDETNVIYQFILSSGPNEIMRGRATVVLDVDRIAK